MTVTSNLPDTTSHESHLARLVSGETLIGNALLRENETTEPVKNTLALKMELRLKNSRFCAKLAI
jgi:hypothetical protein